MEKRAFCFIQLPMHYINEVRAKVVWQKMLIFTWNHLGKIICYLGFSISAFIVKEAEKTAKRMVFVKQLRTKHHWTSHVFLGKFQLDIWCNFCRVHLSCVRHCFTLYCFTVHRYDYWTHTCRVSLNLLQYIVSHFLCQKCHTFHNQF